MKAISCSILALFAIGGAAGAYAQGVTVVCGDGGTTVVRGFTIDGTQPGWPILFDEDTVECGGLDEFPEPLGLSIQQPSAGQIINVSSGTKVVNFAGTIQHFTHPVDTCRSRVYPPPPLGGWPATTLSPNANGNVTTTLTFHQGIALGTYRIELSCQRVISGQQVVVAPVSRNVIVN